MAKRRCKSQINVASPVEQANAILKSCESKKTNGELKLPSTSEKTYSDDELEFLKAMDSYIARTGRKFPMYSEILGVLISLGYRKVTQHNGS